jgi:hypothetical protein
MSGYSCTSNDENGHEIEIHVHLHSMPSSTKSLDVCDTFMNKTYNDCLDIKRIIPSDQKYNYIDNT